MFWKITVLYWKISRSLPVCVQDSFLKSYKIADCRLLTASVSTKTLLETEKFWRFTSNRPKLCNSSLYFKKTDYLKLTHIFVFEGFLLLANTDNDESNFEHFFARRFPVFSQCDYFCYGFYTHRYYWDILTLKLCLFLSVMRWIS